MSYLLAFAYWVAVFVAIGAVLWAYVTLTGLLGMSATAQMVGLLVLVCVFAAVSTVRGLDRL